jgi:hypothetical protein
MKEKELEGHAGAGSGTCALRRAKHVSCTLSFYARAAGTVECTDTDRLTDSTPRAHAWPDRPESPTNNLLRKCLVLFRGFILFYGGYYTVSKKISPWYSTSNNFTSFSCLLSYHISKFCNDFSMTNQKVALKVV